VERFQSYKFLRQGLDPKYGSFSILSAFQNADKHRNLVLVGNGLRDPMVWQIHPDGSTAPVRAVRQPELAFLAIASTRSR
jgi:hypothetical protein